MDERHSRVVDALHRGNRTAKREPTIVADLNAVVGLCIEPPDLALLHIFVF